MRLLRLSTAALWLVTIIGCGRPSDKPTFETAPRIELPSPAATQKIYKKVMSKRWGTIEGMVTFDGNPPSPKDLTPQFDLKASDAAHCKMGKTVDESWVIGGDQHGVANVVVWLRASKDSYFDIPEKLRDRSGETITIRQPFCMFEPHVVVLFPSFYSSETNKQTPTKQVCRVVNDSSIAHSSCFAFVDPPFEFAAVFPPPSGKKWDYALKAIACKNNEAGGERLFKLACNIHPWMSGYGRVFDHPFFAITSGGKADDKEFGTYRIESAPAGVELELVYWHESMRSPQVLKKVTLIDGGSVREDFKIK